LQTDFENLSIPGAPPELSGPLPRRVQRSGNGLYGEIVIALMLAFTVVLTIWVGKNAIQQVLRGIALRQNGAEVVGEITQIKPVPRSTDRVSYSFTVNGKTFSGNAGVPAQLERKLRESGALTVRYLSTDPTVNHPAAWEVPLWSSLGGMLGLNVLTSMFALANLLIYKERTLIAQGRPAIATVTECTPGTESFSLEYEFRTGMESINGKGWSPIHREIGAKIWILYAPQNPSRNRPYPLSNYRVKR
jgi:hypothetical protein